MHVISSCSLTTQTICFVCFIGLIWFDVSILLLRISYRTETTFIAINFCSFPLSLFRNFCVQNIVAWYSMFQGNCYFVMNPLNASMLFWVWNLSFCRLVSFTRIICCSAYCCILFGMETTMMFLITLVPNCVGLFIIM